MSLHMIRTALGLLQDDPDLESAWHDLQDAVTAPDVGHNRHELAQLLHAARRAHEARREWDAVTKLLELEIALRAGDAEEVPLQAELARIFEEELLDDEQATRAYQRLLAIRHEDATALEALERNEAKRAHWRPLVDRYLAEASDTRDPSFRSSLLLSATETAWRFGRSSTSGVTPAKVASEAIPYLEQALTFDPHNRRALLLLERIYRSEGRWSDAARVLEALATDEGASKEERLAAMVRLARLGARYLNVPERAAAAYERVLDIAPGHAEAMRYLAEYFSAREQWGYLVGLYEDQLRSGGVPTGQEAGMVFQIAMVHWRMGNQAEAAEPWFERLRKVEPAHPGMLTFFREWCEAKRDSTRLLTVLTDAQRALADGPERAAISSEIAQLAEGEANAVKAIEQYKALLRQDPSNRIARDALKRLYRQTESWNALVELLRQELERISVEDRAARLSVLREVADIYKHSLKSDTAFVTVLAQVVQLDEHDVEAIRDLVRVYESLSRWRDLLTYQQKLADLLDDPLEKVALYRSAARRWLEQFSNVQNALDAYEALLRVDSTDAEAISKLRELYTKRRAWPQLYALCERELAGTEGKARVDLLVEMAKLAAERLDRGSAAIQLYKEALTLDDGARGTLDALEKQAEREKDFATVAEVLERRVEAAPDEATRLAVLQKLGSVYADRLGNATLAASAWQRVLRLQPGHAKALRVLRDTYLASNDLEGLEALYASQDDWEGLAEVLSAAADRTNDPSLKVEFSLRTAQVFEERLQQPDRAFRGYERILSVHPDDIRAARALVPIYEREERWARLPALYEILLDHAADTASRVALYRKLADITGRKLQDRAAALVYARKAFDVDPTAEGALAFLERSSREAGSWDTLVDAIRSRLREAGPSDQTDRRVLQAKLAEIYATEQGNLEQAVATYRTLVEEDPTDTATLATLDRLLRAAGRYDDLRWLFEVRASNVEDTERARLYNEWATLEEEVFGDPAQAIVLYRRVLELVPDDHAALSSLPRLLMAAGDALGAADVLALRRDLSDGFSRADRELDLAELYIEPLGRLDEALEAAVRALALRPHDARAVGMLERMMVLHATRARAAEVLQEEYSETGDARREAGTLRVLLDATEEPGARLALHNRLAEVYERKLGASGTALDVILQALGEFPKELALWDRAGDLAVASGRPTHLAEALKNALRGVLPEEIEVELCERAALLHDEKLGDPQGAIPYLERVLARQPTNERAFLRLKQIFTSAERWAQLESLYERVCEATQDDARKVELYAEVALVCEEITGENAKAIAYFERILELDPMHEHALRSLDTLYQRERRMRELASLLDRRLAVANPEESLELKLRLGRVYLEDLHEPPLALVHLEEVLREDLNNAEARVLVERLLEIGSLRPRAAELLESVYEARGQVRDLVRVLEIRLETAANDDLRRELLRRIALLRDQRLQDDAGSLETLAKLVPLDPSDANARARLQEIGRRLGKSERVAEVLLRAAQNADTIQQKAGIEMEVAHVYEDWLADRDRAEATYRRVVDLDPTDASLVLPAAQALERIYIAAENHQALAEVLQLQVPLELNGRERQELWARLGELRETLLNRPEEAVQAWHARLEENPADDASLAALERLYEKLGLWRELVETLRAREQITTNPIARRRLMTKTAEILASRLGDTQEAIQAWRALVDEFGPDRPTLAALASLYEHAQSWYDLAHTLEADLTLAEEPESRLALQARLGDVRREHLDDLPGALEAYRQALILNPSHAPSRVALEQLLDLSEACREAAEILHPLYEADGDNERLLRVLDIEIETADTPAERLLVLDTAVRVAEGALTDRARAFSYTMRAVREAAGDPSLPRWLERLEGLAQVTGNYEELIAVLSQIASEILDEEMQLRVTLRIAELARSHRGDQNLARDWYKKALEIRSDERSALIALESVYEEMGDTAALLDILKRRVEVSTDNIEKKYLLYREAKLTRDALTNPVQAIGVYEAILDLGLDPPAIEALEELYTATERYEDQVALYERQIAEHPRNEADLHVKLAHVAERNLGDVPRAFEELEAALDLDSQHRAAIAGLEGLLDHASDPDHRARAGELLEPVYLRRADWKNVMRAILARLASSQDPEERCMLLRRVAQLQEEQEEDYRAALETTAELFRENMEDEGTWEELERLAKVAGNEARLAEIYAAGLQEVTVDEPYTAQLSQRTAELYASLGDIDHALVFYRRALAFEPESRALFAALDALLIRSGQAPQRVELYRSALDHRTEPSERLTILHTIANLEENSLSSSANAIETYRSALDVDERDTIALESLTRLYRSEKRWRDLADLYLRRIDMEEGDAQVAARFRLAVARLYRDELGDVSACVDQLESIVQILPHHKDAIAELERLSADPEHKARVVDILRPLYEQADSWKDLIRLNEQRLSLADDPIEKIAIYRETAHLFETRAGDQGRAFLATQMAFDLDPEDTDTRSELERLAAALGSWGALAESYERGIGSSQGQSKRDLLQALAELHDTRRDDPRQALDAYERLFALDESDIEPLQAMDGLTVMLSDWSTLVYVLTKKAELTLHDDERASLWRRIGEAKRDMLEDVPGAMQAYERALELDPANVMTVDALIELYEQEQDAARLVDLYRRRVELSSPEELDLKYTLLMRAAPCYEDKLGNAPEAIDALREALYLRSGDKDALRALDRLFRAQQMWPELLENLRAEATAAQSATEQIELQRAIGDLFREKLDDPSEALVSYQQVLAERSTDEASIAAVQAIGEAHEELRLAAADILEPVLRSCGRWADLIHVLELRLQAQSESMDRARTLRTMALIEEINLSHPDQAQTALLRALNEVPEDDELHAEIERLSAASSAFDRYAEALKKTAAAGVDSLLSKDLYMRLGRVAEEKLGDDPRAIAAYQAAVDQAGDTPELLAALDRLYTKTGDARSLADVLERRVVTDEDPGVRAEHYYRLAKLQLDSFKEPEAGLSTLRLCLETQPDHRGAREALEALTEEPSLFEEVAEMLEEVYRVQQAHEPLVKLLEKRIAHASSAPDRIRVRLELMRVLEDQLKDIPRAQAVVQEALTDDPSDVDVLGELERLASLNQGFAAATSALEKALVATDSLTPDVVRDLYMRLSEWYRQWLHDPHAAEGALEQALARDPESLDILRALEALRRVPGRERDLVETLRRRARVETDLESKRTLLREAKTLAEEQAHDGALAEAVLRQMLEENEADLWALEELTRLREAAADWQEAHQLMLSRAGLVTEGSQAAQLRHRAAQVLCTHLGNTQGALALYEELFENDPNDVQAYSALRSLYEHTGSYRELVRLLERLIEVVTSPVERTQLRLALARLQSEKLDAPADAIDALRAILDEEAHHTEAVVMLSQLYERTGKDDELAELLTTQTELARERGDIPAELAFKVRLGEIYEARLGDLSKAIETYQEVLDQDPMHKGALYAVARLYEAKMQQEEASAALEKLLEIEQGPELVAVAVRLADSYTAQKNNESARRSLERGLSADPAYAGLRERLRVLYEKTGEWGKLAELLAGDAERAESPAEKVKLLRQAAEILQHKQQDAAAAAALLERASELTPEDRDLLLALCDAYSVSGRGRDAASALEKVVASYGGKRSKELAVIHHRLAKAYLAEAERDRALTELDAAFKIDPGSVAVLRDLGLLTLETGDLERAQKTFRALLLQKLDPSAPITKAEVFYYLGEIAYQQGDKPKAMQMLERSVENDPELQKAKTRLSELKA